LNITPLNADEAFGVFEESGRKDDPVFTYRPLDFDPDSVKRELFELDIEGIDDELVRRLLLAKRAELDAIATILQERDTPRFLHLSTALHGEVEDDLLDEAERILSLGVEPYSQARFVDAEELAEQARAELDGYRAAHPGLAATVEVRSDVTGLMVVYGNLLVGMKSRFRPERVQPLIQHEVGTHIVTYENGRMQPLQLMCVGLADYDETQEALAVFAEYLVGGLDPERLALLATRVIAARRVSEGASFVDVFGELVERGADARGAWSTTMRALRCGGTTKDAIYLRGLLRLLDYIAAGHALEPLLVGKLPLADVLLIEELLNRGVLKRPVLLPRWLAWEGAEQRLQRARAGMKAEDLVHAAAREAI
jgi:uncharacterized protein (TIGR02421 family)